ncbi:MAG: Hsp20/alpha crystallin family protein [Caldimonas sp.]
MGLDLQTWNPFKFIRGSTEARPAGSGAADGAPSSERSLAEAPEASRMLQSLDPFGLLPSVFRSPFGGAAGVGHWFGDFTPSLFQPRLDIVDDGDALRLTAELPGMEKQDLELIAEDGFLVLRGEKRVDTKQEEKGCYRLERAFGRFQRVLPLPDGVDLEHAEARFDKGVLTLRLPKKAAEGSSAARKLEIH